MRKSRKTLIVRTAVAILSLSIVIGLLPFTVLAEDEGGTAGSDRRFDSIIDPGKPSGYSDTMANPYGYPQGQKFLFSEQNELLLYYTFDTQSKPEHKYTAWYDDYEKGKGTSLRDNKDGFGSYGMYSNTRAYAYVDAVGFDPNGTGRRDHVAYVGYENGKTGGEKGYYLWVMNTVSGEQYGPVRVSNASCEWLQNNNADLYAGSNFFNIAAGDFNGDGKDDLIVGIVDDNLNYGLSQIRFSGGRFQQLVRSSKGLLHPLYGQLGSQIDFGNKGGKAKDKLSMDLAVGDFNGDGLDDLAVLSYPNTGNALNNTNIKDQRFGMPYLAVSYGASGSGNVVAGAAAATYLNAGKRTVKDFGMENMEMEVDGVTLTCGAVAAGDIDGDGRDEILTAGYEGCSVTDQKTVQFAALSMTYLLYGSFFASGGSLTNIEYQELKMNEWTKNRNGRMDDVGPKFSVEAVAVDGKGSRERIFLSGDMYKCEPQSNKLYIQPSNTPDDAKESPITLDYFKRDDKYSHTKKVGKSYIAATAVGNFEETTEGREQIAYVVGLQTSDSKHEYSFSVHIAGGKEYEGDTAKNYYCATGNYIFCNQGFNLDKRPNCVIAAIDRDNDGIVASYRGAAYAWSDPSVRAVLQASPYFSELNDAENGYEFLNDTPETHYATSVTYSFETESSNSVSFGAGFAGQAAGRVGPQVDLQAGYAMDWSESFTKTLEKSVTNTFSAGFYDTVVLYRTPVFVYSYDVWYLDANGNPQTDILQFSIPKAPRYEQLSIKRYNEFVDYYNAQILQAGEKQGLSAEKCSEAYLEKLADDLFLNTEGDPYGYYIDDVSGGLNPAPEQYGLLMKLARNAGQNSIEYTYEESEGETREVSHGFTFDLTVTFGFDIGAVAARAGGYVSLQYMHGNSVTKTNGTGTAFGGTVAGIDGNEMEKAGINPDAWSFNWRLARWDSNLKDKSENSTGKVPIIGFVLSNVQSPPLPVENLTQQFTRASENAELYFDLQWDCGDVETSNRPKTAGYRIYLYDPASGRYKLIQTIEGAENTSYRYEDFFDGREYYGFMVTAYSEASFTSPSLESAPRYETYYMSTADTTILKIVKTGTDGLTDTYTIYFANGTTQTFTVTNGNGIVSIALLSSDAETGVDTYQITFADGSTTTFTVTNGADGEKGEKGETGAPGVGIERIEKLRSEGNVDIYAVYLTDGTFYTFPVRNGVDGKDGKDGKDGADGRDGEDGKDGENGKDGADGKSGTDGRNGTDGRSGMDSRDGKDGQNGKDGADGVGIADIRIGEDGSFLFTLSDGRVINVGIPEENNAQAKQLAEMQTQLETLRQQVERQNAVRTVAYCGMGLAAASFLWQIIALILALTRRKEKDTEKVG